MKRQRTTLPPPYTHDEMRSICRQLLTGRGTATPDMVRELAAAYLEWNRVPEEEKRAEPYEAGPRPTLH